MSTARRPHAGIHHEELDHMARCMERIGQTSYCQEPAGHCGPHYGYIRDQQAPLHDFEQAHAEQSRGLDYGEECTLHTESDYTLHCPAFPEPCSYVRITEKHGDEVAYWSSDEWRDDPETVMGAIIGALKRGATD